MTEVLKAYLDFVKKNKEKMEKATSADAYNQETYFEMYYDATADVVLLHCDLAGEVETQLVDSEEINAPSVQEELDNCVAEIKLS